MEKMKEKNVLLFFIRVVQAKRINSIIQTHRAGKSSQQFSLDWICNTADNPCQSLTTLITD